MLTVVRVKGENGNWFKRIICTVEQCMQETVPRPIVLMIGTEVTAR